MFVCLDQRRWRRSKQSRPLSHDAVSRHGKCGVGTRQGQVSKPELDGWCGPPLVWAGWLGGERQGAGFEGVRGNGPGCLKEERPHLSKARGTGTSTLRVIWNKTRLDWGLRPESHITRLSDFVCVLSCVRLFVNPWTVARKAPLSTEFSGQEYWSGCHFLLQGNLPDPGIDLSLLHLLQWQAGSLLFVPPGQTPPLHSLLPPVPGLEPSFGLIPWLLGCNLSLCIVTKYLPPSRNGDLILCHSFIHFLLAA